jgi:uncharacterized protein (TIGR02757 family)
MTRKRNIHRISKGKTIDLAGVCLKKYNAPSFIPSDPVSIPHRFRGKEEREISGFLAATLAWGRRDIILKSCDRLLRLMEDAPYDFVMNASAADLKPLNTFVHRTFNGTDAVAFVKSLQHVYRNHGGLEAIFTPLPTDEPDTGAHITRARGIFFELKHPTRTEKHFADPSRGSAAKRINMFLRWMVRRDENGVDFGIWKSISPAQLICPLDVHSGRVARKLGLLTHKQNNWKGAVELTANLRELDTEDPVRFDYVLFGLGVDGDL